MKCVVFCCPLCQQRLLLTIAEQMPVPGEPACMRCGHTMVAVSPPRRPSAQQSQRRQPATLVAP
jgi:hypothetical protein